MLPSTGTDFLVHEKVHTSILIKKRADVQSFRDFLYQLVKGDFHHKFKTGRVEL